MGLVKELVQKAMSLLSNDLMDSLMARLEVTGVNSVNDLSFVKTEDFDGMNTVYISFYCMGYHG